MLRRYFKLDGWSIYLLALAMVALTVLFVGIIGPYTISSASNLLVMIGFGLILIVYPFLMFVFGKPFINKLKRNL